MQANGAGQRDKQQSLTGGGFGQHSGEQSYAPVKEVGNGCDRELLRLQTTTDGIGLEEGD